MKFLDKLSLKIFSIIILVMSIVMFLIVTGILPVSFITSKLINMSDGSFNIKIALSISAIFLLLSIKGLFFTGKQDEDAKDGIILENTSGKLVITKESLQNLIASIVKEIPGAESISSRTILDKNKNLIVFVTTVVSRDIMIKDISSELQIKIKEALNKTADLEVKEVNIKIKNITSKKVKGLPAPKTSKNEEENTGIESESKED